MKLSFNPTSKMMKYYHQRSESTISIQEQASTLLITFSNDDGDNATLEIMNIVEAQALKDSMSDLKSNSHKGPRRFNQGYIVLNVGYDNYGDPYEECVQFTFTLADTNKQWREEEVRASLSMGDASHFKATLINFFTTKET
jgi:hypothetical protein